MNNFEREFPMGRPDALFCRWCNNFRKRTALNGVLLCSTCDGPALDQRGNSNPV